MLLDRTFSVESLSLEIIFGKKKNTKKRRAPSKKRRAPSKKRRVRSKKQSEWITHVKAFYNEKRKKDPNYKYSQALKEAKDTYKADGKKK